MGDIIDLDVRRAQQKSVADAVDDLDPATMPTSLDLRMARALLIAQKEQKDTEWVEATNKVKKRRSTLRASFLILGLCSGLLQWWWVMGTCVVIMLLANKLVTK